VPVGVRFNPPRPEPPPGLAWVFGRAFGPIDVAAALPEPTHMELRLARRLGVLGRTVARIEPSPRSPDATDLSALRAIESERATATRALLRDVASIANARSIRVVELAGPVGELPPESLELLVDGECIRALIESLSSRLGTVPTTHIAFGDGVLVQWPRHRRVLFWHRLPRLRLVLGGHVLDLSGAVWAKLVAWEDGPSTFGIASPEFSFAHLVAQYGVTWNNCRPYPFPTVRMLGDIIDGGWHRDEGLVLSAHRLLRTDIACSEVRALLSLSRCVLEGQAEALWRQESPEARVLRHLTLRSTSRSYRAKVLARERLEVFAQRVSPAWLRPNR
jgi:hypothetical protein